MQLTTITYTATSLEPDIWLVFIGDAPTGYTIEKLRAGFLLKYEGVINANGYVFASVRHALAWLNDV